MKSTLPFVPVARAQRDLPRLCRSGETKIITNHDTPVTVIMPVAHYEALIETIDLLSNPAAMQVLRAAKAGKLKYKKLDLKDENFGL